MLACWKWFWVPILLLNMGCGADGYVTTEPPETKRCPSLDTYLAGVYELVENGELSHLQAVIQDEFSDDLQGDLVGAIIDLMARMDQDMLVSLSTTLSREDEVEPVFDQLGALLRWLAKPGEEGIRTKVFGVLRTVVNACEGDPVFRLLAEVAKEPALGNALLELLRDTQLSQIADALVGESGENREAFRTLYGNVLATAASPDLDVNALLDLVGLVFDLDAGTGQAFRDIALAFFSNGPQKTALQGTLRCLASSDPEAVLADLVFDLMADKPFSVQTLIKGSIIEELGQPVAKLSQYLADDAAARETLASVLTVLLADNLAPGLLEDLATLIDSNAVGDLASGLGAVATHTCD
jgi:hypothetical protein